MRKNVPVIILLVLFSLPAIFALFHSGFFQSDDGEWMVIRFSAFYQAFVDGQFPVRFLHRLNFGYGYPVATFLYPGFMYFGIPIHLIGFGFVNTIKIVIGLSLVGSSIFTYLWLSKLFSKYASILGAIVYLYLPYHLYDVYVRGSVGEVFALVWLPFVFWQIERKSTFWTSLGIALIIISHNTLALLFMPLIVLYMITKTLSSTSQRLQLYQYTSILVFGIGLASFYWLPAITEVGYTNFSNTSISNPENYFADFGLIDFISVGALLVVIYMLLWKKKIIHYHTIPFFVVGVLSIFLSSSLSKSIWSIAPSQYIQFPFRMLSLTIPTTAFLLAALVDKVQYKKFMWNQWYRYPILVVLIASVGYVLFFYPKTFFDKGEGYYFTNEATTTVQDEYMPKWVKEKPTTHFKEKVKVISGDAQVSNVEYDNKNISFKVNATSKSDIQVSTIYWPGWRDVQNNLEVGYDNLTGTMMIDVSTGKHVVHLKFEETNTRLVADLLSVISLLILIAYSILLKRKNEKNIK